MNSLITATECRMLKKVSAQVETTVIDLLVTRFDKLVRQAAKSGESQVTVSVPRFLFGQAEFDYVAVQNAIRHVFENNGFKSVLNKDNLILCWKSQADIPLHANSVDLQAEQGPAKKVVRIA